MTSLKEHIDIFRKLRVEVSIAGTGIRGHGKKQLMKMAHHIYTEHASEIKKMGIDKFLDEILKPDPEAKR